MKKVYQKPQSEIISIKAENSVISTSVESMNAVVGSWDEETE